MQFLLYFFGLDYALYTDLWVWPLTLTFNPRRAMFMIHE